ncbi:unnamed protein product [Protopolystoma xenopodis]|uniref:Myosin tail domain-containing protein n=1 Tax=Protopolystoma xenopodis TaxID=117903 RepID=A0A3S5CJB3_9PLAT|nr:unnamed protein product [Protopolystoma xenopodis]
MSVQLRSLEARVAEERRELRRAIEDTIADKETIKRAARAQKTRAERLMEELQRTTSRLADAEARSAQIQNELEEERRHVSRLTSDRASEAANVDELRCQLIEMERRSHATERAIQGKIALTHAGNSDSSNVNKYGSEEFNKLKQVSGWMSFIRNLEGF